MRKKNNSGFSIVEVLIALAIFLILMLPITKGIIQALNMTTGSKELQYRNEFAEGIMEHVKSVDIDELLASKYYLDMGTDASSLNTSKKLYCTDTTDPDYAGAPLKNSEGKDFEYAQYQVSGSVKLGTKHEEYNYLVDVDSYEYAYAGANTPEDVFYLDPNNMALGIVENVDYTKVALIDDQIVNYDKMAENALKAKKLQALRETDELSYLQAIQNPDYLFDGEGNRLMTIKVSGDKANGYKVQCILDYYDDSSALSSAGYNNYVEYTPYGKTFTKELPNIYVLYNPCRYNGNYTRDDYVTVDTSELKDSREDVKLFLVETASTFSQAIIDADALDAVNNADSKSDAVFTENQVLYNPDYANSGQDRDSTKIHVGAIVGSGNNSSSITKIHVYSNIGDNTKDQIDEEGNITKVERRNKKTAKENYLYSDNPDGEKNESGEVIARYAKDTTFTNLVNFMMSNNHDAFVNASFRGLTGSTDNAVVGNLNDAKEQSRGMYDVKVYLKKASEGAIDTSQDLPILQGTKGGNES